MSVRPRASAQSASGGGAVAFALFETALGACAIAWSPRGIRRLLLPEADREATEARLRELVGTAEARPPEAWVGDAIVRITRHMAGTPQDLAALQLDLEEAPAFHRQVYEAARAIPAGQTLTYGELAARVGAPAAARAVGQAMAKNPIPVIVPCHRVLAAGGKPGGFSAYGGRVTKARLLALEGATLPGTATLSLFDGDMRLPFSAETALAHVTARDAPLARTIARVGGFRLKLQTSHSPFESLAESILHQQITGKAAAAIGARLRAAFGSDRYPAPDLVVRAPVTKLRTAGLSKSKALALQDLGAKVLDGTVPTFEAMAAMEDDAIVERLTAVRGIGRWTVEMLLIFRMGRPDVLPSTDYGIRKGFGRVFRKKALPTPGEILKRGERWRPYRTLASWYLWRSLELPAG